MIKRESRDRAKFLDVWVRGLQEPSPSRGIRRVIAHEMGVNPSRVFPPPNIQPINGPRVAGLRLFAGRRIGDVVSLLQRNSMANIHASIPHEDDCPDAIDPKKQPLTSFEGRWYTIQLTWSDRLAEKDIQTQTLLRGSAWGELEANGNRWIAGLESRYEPVYLSLDEKMGSPHYFFIGTTRSGKSTAIENAVAQLAIHPDNRFMFIDAVKKFRDFGPMLALKQSIGPPALNVEAARNALIWLRSEMEARYNQLSEDTRIICVIDELPGLRDDKTCVEIIEAIASAGAQCNIHLFLAAQHAIAQALGHLTGIIKANVGGRMVFGATELSSSVAGMSDSRAKVLGVPGDCWVLNNNFPATRIQASYFPGEFLENKERWKYGLPEMESWPKISKEPYKAGNGNGFSEDLMSKIVAHRLEGRIRKESRGYGRTVIQEKFGLGQNESVRAIQYADHILDTIWNVGKGK